jgi:hypothetical protein
MKRTRQPKKDEKAASLATTLQLSCAYPSNKDVDKLAKRDPHLDPSEAI